MGVTTKQLLEKLEKLPPQRLAEVSDFVDFLRSREEKSRGAATQRLVEAMAKLDALDLPPMGTDEVQAEIEAARSAHGAGSDADRR
jgi:hypothetical protein